MKTRTAAIITRTKDRPVLLKRACKSVIRQTFKDFIWVVVNDGGKPEPVDEIIEEAKQMNIDTMVLHRKASKGMEAASNAGIHASRSKYIVILDDDDSHHPLFLEKTVAFLESNPNYNGVITHSYRVEEEVHGGQCREIRRWHHNDWIKGVYLADMSVENTYPPVSFLFRRSSAEEIGWFNEDLTVLGDWYFNLKFLERFDIGVIPEMLANYHLRLEIKNEANVYGNTIISQIDKHTEFDAIVRNKLLRSDIENNRMGVGFLVNMARIQKEMVEVFTRYKRILNKLDNMLIRIPGFKKLWSRI